MNLDVTKTTFEKYLVNLGYNYKIKQFEHKVNSNPLL